MADNNFLPEEMVMEILLRVPSKSLIRFKSACKPWRTLFSSTQFMAKHLLPNRDTGNFLLVKHRDETNYEYFLSVLFDDTLNVDHSHSLLLSPMPLHPNPNYRPYMQILGSCCCNGFICLYYDTKHPHIVLWSPFAGDVKIVPPSDVPYLQGITTYGLCAPGFGYDANSQDYKVIIVTIDDGDIDHLRSVDGFKLDIYSSTSDSWRGVYRDLPARVLPFGSMTRVYTNGVFSWWASNLEDAEGELEYILWFRVRDESLGTFRLPPNRSTYEDDSMTKYNSKITVLNDQFSVIMFDWKKNIYRDVFSRLGTT